MFTVLFILLISIWCFYGMVFFDKLFDRIQYRSVKIKYLLQRKLIAGYLIFLPITVLSILVFGMFSLIEWLVKE